MLAVLLSPVFVAVPSAGAVDVFNENLCERQVNNSNSSAVCTDKNVGNENPLFGPSGILTAIINILTIVVGIAAVIMIVFAGLRYVTSGSNPQDAANARERIVYALVALVVAGLAQVLVRFVLSAI